MPCYEHVFIARPNISAQRMQGLMGDFSAVIKNGGGDVARTEYWGLRNLAYRIGKNRKGHYAMLNIEAPQPVLAEMERQMRLHEDVVRFLTIKVETLSEEPSPPMRQRLNAEAGRAEAGRPGQEARDKPGDKPEDKAEPTDAKADAPEEKTEEKAEEKAEPSEAQADDGADVKEAEKDASPPEAEAKSEEAPDEGKKDEDPAADAADDTTQAAKPEDEAS